MKRTLVVACSLAAGFALVYALMSDKPYLMTLTTILGTLALAYCGYDLFDIAGAIPRGVSFRRGFATMAFGVWVWAGASLMQVWGLSLNRAPYGTIADGFWVFGYVPLLMGLARLRTNTVEPPGTQWRLILFSLPLLAAFALCFHSFILPQLQDANREWFQKMLDITYPSADLVLSVLALSAMLHNKGSQATFLLFFVGFLILAISDVVLGHVATENSFLFKVLDVPYFVAYMLIAWGVDLFRLKLEVGEIKFEDSKA